MATLDRLAPPPSASAVTAWNPRRAIVVAVLAATTIALLQVVQSSSFAHRGQELQQLEAQRTSLASQSHDLEAEIAALSSLERTERAARERLGMVAPMKLDYVSVQVEAPAGPLLPRPIIEPAVKADPKLTPWWQSLLESLSLR